MAAVEEETTLGAGIKAEKPLEDFQSNAGIHRLVEDEAHTHRDFLERMQEAYGEDDGWTMFRQVVLTPRKYQDDKRPLVHKLARKLITGGNDGTRKRIAVMKKGLTEFYNALGGPNWSTSTPGWARNLQLNRLKTWYGVTLDDHDMLVGIKLVHNNLEGRFSEACDKLCALERVSGHMTLLELSLASNEMTGPIPESVQFLKSLRILALQFNQLSGALPQGLAKCDSIVVLNLQDNRFSGPIPPQLSSCSALRIMHLYSNQLTGNLPPELAQLHLLTELRVWDNQLTGPIPPEYGNLKNLQVFHAGQNQLSGPIPTEIAGMEALEYLYLNDNRLTGSIPVAAFANIQQLKSVYLSNNSFADLQGTEELFRTMLPNVERDLNGEGLLYYGTEYPVAQKGSVRSNAILF